MVKFLSINFFLGFLQFLLGFSKVPVFFVSPVSTAIVFQICPSETRGIGHKSRLRVTYTEPQTTRSEIIITVNKRIYETKINIHSKVYRTFLTRHCL